MSTIKKILQKNYRSLESFPRAEVERELSQADKFPSKKKFKCKRNKGDHVWVHVKPDGKVDWKRGGEQAQYLANLFQKKNDGDVNWKNWWYDIYKCSACGKVDMRRNKE